MTTDDNELLRRYAEDRSEPEQTHAMNDLLQSANSDPNWPQLRPILDDAMHDLSATDRDAVLLRYFQQRPLAEIGVRLGLTENAARMRVDRALDKLRNALAKRGVTSMAAALTVGLAQHAVGAAPGGLALAVGREAMSAGAVAGSGLAAAVLGAAKSPILLGGVAVAVLVVGVWMVVSRTPGAVSVSSAAVASTVVPTSEVADPMPAVSGNRAVEEGLVAVGLLRLRVVNTVGLPIPQANVWYMRRDDITVRPDGTEHEIVLTPALTISGTVTDERTGDPIPREVNQ